MRRARWKKKALGVTFAPQRSDRGSPQTLPTKSGSLLPGAEDLLLIGSFPPQVAEVRRLSGWKTERSVLLFPRVPLPRKGDATSVRRQSRQRLSSRYALPGWLVGFRPLPGYARNARE